MSRKTLTRRLDKACSKAVRSRGVCAMCGKEDYSKLQCCHIFSRTYRSVRWNLDNLLCLCAGCHFLSHKNPVFFTEFVRQYLGEIRYQQLKDTAIPIKKWSEKDMEVLLKKIESEYATM